MASNLQTFITALISHYSTNISALETVIQSSKEEDLKKYEQDDLPLLAIRLYNTGYKDQYSREVDTESPIVISLYYIDWSESETTLQDWIEDVIEATPTTLSSHVIQLGNNTQVEAINLEYPLCGFKFTPFVKGMSSRSNI